MSGTARPRPLSDGELRRAFAYLHGELDERERIAFELELSEDQALAEGFEPLAAMDRLQQASSAAARAGGDRRATGPRPASGWRSWGPFRGLAAAAVLVAFGTLAWVFAPWRQPYRSDVGLLATGFTLAEQYEVMGLSAELRDSVDRSGAGRGSQVPEDAREYLELLHEREAARGERALENAADTLRATHYSVRLRVSAPSRALVINVDERDATRAYPADGAGRLLEPGVLHTLPEDGFALDETGERVVFRSSSPGFYLPASLARRSVLVATTDAIDAAPIPDELDALLRGLDAEQPPEERARAVRAWLEERGFSVAITRVQEP